MIKYSKSLSGFFLFVNCIFPDSFVCLQIKFSLLSLCSNSFSMLHFKFLLFVLLVGSSVFAQIKFDSGKVFKITYSVSYNGNTDENQNPIWVFADENQVLISSRDHIQGKGKFPFEMTFVEPNQKKYNQIAFLNSDESIAVSDAESIGKQKFELESETKMILGYRCQKAKTVINSNTIEIWYTNDLGIKGGPSVLGLHLGLVLEL